MTVEEEEDDGMAGQDCWLVLAGPEKLTVLCCQGPSDGHLTSPPVAGPGNTAGQTAPLGWITVTLLLCY